MGFAHLQVARGRVTRPLGEVAIAIRPMGRGKVSTVQIYLAPDTLRAGGLLIGDRVEILVGDGEDEGRVRLIKAKKGEGDVRIRTTSNAAVGFLASRMIPRSGIDKFRRVEIGFSVVYPGCIEIELPWFSPAEEEDFKPQTPEAVERDPWENDFDEE